MALGNSEEASLWDFGAWGLPASNSLLGFLWVQPPAGVGVLLFHPADAKTEAPEVFAFRGTCPNPGLSWLKLWTLKSGCLVLSPWARGFTSVELFSHL